jgi:hypothetical protein
MPTLTVHDTAAIRRIEEAIGYTFYEDFDFPEFQGK